MKFFEGNIRVTENEMRIAEETKTSLITEKYTKWKTLLQEEILPRWINYLQGKKDKELESNSKPESRTDTVGKKIVRDWREFYRIIWNYRYSFLNNKSKPGYFESCLRDFLETLDINGEFSTHELGLYKEFFLRRTRRTKEQIKMNVKVEEKGYKDFLCIYKKYRVKLRNKIVLHPVFGKLFIMLFYTLLPLYIKEMKKDFKDIA